MPEPRWVMAVGTCAVSGGIAEGGYAAGHGLEGVLPVDVYLPGCPPNPAAIMHALMMFLQRVPQRVNGGQFDRMNLSLAGFIAWVLAAGIALSGRGIDCRTSPAVWRLCRGLDSGNCRIARRRSYNNPADRLLPVNRSGFLLTPDGLWLLGFGLAPAALACAVSSPSPRGQSGWLFGAAMSLIGALGVFGLQDGASFLIAWEVMSFGGARHDPERNVLMRTWAGPFSLCWVFWRLEPLHCSLPSCCSHIMVRTLTLHYFTALLRALPAAARHGRWHPSGYRFWCKAWAIAILRMVSGRLWRRKRRVGRSFVGRRAQRRVLRIEPGTAGLAARPDFGRHGRTWNFSSSSSQF